MKSKISLFLAIILGACTSVFAQISTPTPSPQSTVTQQFALGELSVVYARPAMKGRVIFGDLVPMDKIWRTGANASTKFKTTDEIMLEGNKIPAGTYALYTIPGKTTWTIIIHKNTSHWGDGGANYKAEEDLVRFTVPVQKVAQKMESFTIDFSDIQATTTKLNISWSDVKVSINISADIDARVSASIDRTLNPQVSAGAYFQAASYYFDNNKDMAKALEWVNKATEMNKTAFWMIHLKAKIQAKMNDHKGAIETAKLSIEEAKKANNADYVALNEKLIADSQKKLK